MTTLDYRSIALVSEMTLNKSLISIVHNDVKLITTSVGALHKTELPSVVAFREKLPRNFLTPLWQILYLLVRDAKLTLIEQMPSWRTYFNNPP